MKKNMKIRAGILALGLILLSAIFGGCGTQESFSVRVGSMKGPTSMGLLFFMEKAKEKNTQDSYEFQMVTTADELVPLLIKEELDIALLPANIASVLYGKTEGNITVIDVNTLGVLYMVSGNPEEKALENFADLKGKTIYLTGKGTTPDFVLQYLLKENGIKPGECTLEYKSEAAEVAALLSQDPGAIGLLPQPFAAAACDRNRDLAVIFDMNAEWEKIQGESGSRLVTGVTVVRNDFLLEHEEAVLAFLSEHEASVNAINRDVEKGAALMVEADIAAKESIAKEAIPKCSITFLEGQKMKEALSGYLEVLYGQAPEAVGGALPEEDFYYIKQQTRQ